MLPIGCNFWSVNDGNENIRAGYLFSEKRSEYCWRSDLWGTWAVAKPAAVRLPFILCERDDVPTDFSHIPPTAKEVSLFRNAVRNCPMPERYVTLARLWESSWVADEQGVNLGDNPFPDPQAMADALFRSLDLLTVGLPLGVRIDLDCETRFDDAFRLYYPRAAELCRSRGIEFSVSVIMDPAGDTQRHIDAVDAIARITEPDYIELHWNGATAEQVWKRAAYVIGDTLQAYGLPVIIGECDCDLTPHAMGALLDSAASRVIVWQ
jgi:hypothetical protein